MKRLRRWLFNLAAGVSFVLCIGIAVFWLRSYQASDALQRIAVNARSDGTEVIREFHLRSLRGSVSLWWDVVEDSGSNEHLARGLAWSSTPASGLNFVNRPRRVSPAAQYRDMTFLGLEWITMTHSLASPHAYSRVDYFLRLPLWMLFLLSMILPAKFFQLRVRSRKNNRRAQAKLCVRCGYDLRATPDRCPECGAVPEAAKGVAG